MSFSINIDSLLKSLLISGASGFLGSHLFNFFSKKNEFQTFGLIRSSSDLSRINSENLKNLFVIDQTDFEHIFKKYRIEVVINTVCNYGRKNESEQSLINSNYLFGKKLVEISNKYNVDLFINTDTLLTDDINLYSKTKALLRKYFSSKIFNIKIVNLRIDHMYGPGDDENKFIYWLIKKLRLSNDNIELTTGEQKRDFIYIDDVINAYSFIISNNHKKFDINYDLITHEFITVKNFVFLLANEMEILDNKEYKSRLIFGVKDYRENDVMIPVTNSFSLTKEGWGCNIKIKKGIKKLLNKIKQ